MDEDWEVLSSCLPSDWREQAAIHGALKGLRKDKSADVLLRTLLMHLGCGHSLRETAARARQAGIADMSDVALFKRLRKSKEWLRALCVGMYRECGVELGDSGGFQVRAFDGSVVKEPGRTGSLWRVHYSLRLPALACDHFEVTRTEGEGCGESLSRFPIGPGDHVVADRGYSTAGGLAHVDAAGGYATVRVNTQALRFRTPGGRRPFDLLAAVSGIKRAGAARSWLLLTTVNCTFLTTENCTVNALRAKGPSTMRRREPHGECDAQDGDEDAAEARFGGRRVEGGAGEALRGEPADDPPLDRDGPAGSRPGGRRGAVR